MRICDICSDNERQFYVFAILIWQMKLKENCFIMKRLMRKPGN